MKREMNRRALLVAPVAVAFAGSAPAADAAGPSDRGTANERYLKDNPETAEVYGSIQSELSETEARKVLDALRTAERPASSGGVQSPAQPMGKTCITIHRWVLMVFYVKWKVDGWGATLAAGPAAFGGIAPGVILGAVGIAKQEGASKLKHYIDSHSKWPRRVCGSVS